MSTDIAAIRKRLADATPGPWVATGLPYDGVDDPIVITVAGGTYIAQTTYDMQSVTREHNVDADTLLIAHAPTDLAHLLDHVTPRTIDTAPRDGTSVLLWVGRRWLEGQWERVDGGLRRYAWVVTDGHRIALQYEPTHWLPMPEAPL